MKFIIATFLIIGILSLSNCDQTNTTNLDAEYILKGKSIASATFAALSTNLQKAMKEGGVPNAIEYCNLRASPIVDSLSRVYQADIRRTSTKVRNPKNSPSDLELAQLKSYQENWEAGKQLSPIIQEIDSENIAFYAPISLMPLCEKCHGKIGQTLKESDYKVLQKYYPEDQAFGYKSEDFRGMWSITFKK